MLLRLCKPLQCLAPAKTISCPPCYGHVMSRKQRCCGSCWQSSRIRFYFYSNLSSQISEFISISTVSGIISGVNKYYLLQKKVNRLLKMDTLKYQCIFIIWEAKMEDSEFSLVEGILLCKVNRVTSLVIVKKWYHNVPKTTILLLALYLQGRIQQVLALQLFLCSLKRVTGCEPRRQQLKIHPIM